MCNLSQGIWEKGFQLGKAEVTAVCIANLMKTQNISFCEAMDMLKVDDDIREMVEKIYNDSFLK